MKTKLIKEIGVVGKQFELNVPELLVLVEKWDEIFSAIFDRTSNIVIEDKKVFLTVADVNNILEFSTFIDKLKGKEISLSEARFSLFEDDMPLSEEEIKDIIEHS